MPDDSPATATLEAPTATGEQAPIASAPAAGAETPATPAPEAPAAVEPDIDTLLSKPEALEKLLQHDRAKKEIEHRAKSTRDADTQRAVQQALAAERERLNAEADRRAEAARDQRIEQTIQKLLEEDPTDPRIAPLKADLDERAQKRAAAKHDQELTAAEVKGIRTVTNGIAAMLQHMNLLDPEDLATIDPSTGKYPTDVSWVQAVYETVAKRAEKRGEERALKTLLPKEREAIKQEQLAQERQREQSPARLPDGAAAKSDDDFLAEFGSGKAHDFKRAKQLLGL